MKKIILTGGGTAGHVMPHLALIDHLKKDYEIHYLGSANGIEKQIISQFPFIKYHTITTVKLARQLTPKNLLIPFKLLKGIAQCKKAIKEIKPSIIFSKGGFVSVPVVFAASSKKIPVISHESDLTLGLANKLTIKKCKVMCCSFKQTVNQNPNKLVYTGTPIRPQLFKGDKQKALSQCNFKNPQKTTLLVMGGSLGAKAINKKIEELLPELEKKYNVIHIVGKNNLNDINNSSYKAIEFTTNIEDYLALADLIVSRAGSNAINEFLALQKPMLLIPLPKSASRGDQLLNAQEFEKLGYAHVLYQENMTNHALLNELKVLSQKNYQIVQKMQTSVATNATQAILNLIQKHQL